MKAGKVSSGLFALLQATALMAAPVQTKLFQDGDTVVFFGDSITHGGRYHEFIADYYLTRFPEAKIRIVNSGIGGDCANLAMPRVAVDVGEYAPTWVGFHFGMNDIGRGHYTATPAANQLMGMNAAQAGYRNSLTALVKAVRAAAPKARHIYFTPTIYDDTAIPTNMPKGASGWAAVNQRGCNTGLALMAGHVLSAAKKDGALGVDWFSPLQYFLMARRADDPHYMLTGWDRVHPGALGHSIMAWNFLFAQGAPAVVSDVTLDAAALRALACTNAAVSQIAREGEGLSFTLAATALPFPVASEALDAARELKIEERLNREVLRVTGLAAGNWELTIDGTSVGIWSAADLAAGIRLGFNAKTPQYRQAQEVFRRRAELSAEERLMRNNHSARWFYGIRGAPVDDLKAFAEWFEKKEPNKKGGFASFVPGYLAYWPQYREKRADLLARQEALRALARPKPHRYVMRPSKSAAARRSVDYNIRDYGASPSASGAVNTKAIGKAVEAAFKAGGGRVIVPVGTWTSGTIWLKDNVELHLEKGARIVGSLRKEDYNRNDADPDNWASEGEEWSGGHLIFATRATNVAVTGEGVLDGSGPKFFGPCDEIGRFPWYKYGLKLKPLDRVWFRPGFMLCFLKCRNVRLSDVTLKDTPCWTVHFRCCEDVTVERVTVDADRTIANSDGVSFDCTRHAVLRDSKLFTGDDGVTIRASCHAHAATNVCEDIVVENCDISSCCHGVRIGVGMGTISNVVVRNCRIHESAQGIGLNPAFKRKAKNVYISDIRIENCTVRESENPIVGATLGGDLIRDIVVKDCDFEALRPSRMAGKADSFVQNVTFERCRHKYLPKLKVNYDLGWDSRAGVRSHELLSTNEFCRNVKMVDCLPRPAGESGVLVLSFDDRNFAGWESAIPIFAKYGAHATFFVSGPIDNAAVRTLKKLSQAGHSIGLHGLNHANADQAIAEKGAEKYFWDDIVPQKDGIYWAYIPCSNFAYPNCRRTDESDKLFYAKGYQRVRGGVSGATPYDPKGEKQAQRKPLVTNEAVFFPASELPKRRRLDTIIMGEAYHTDINEILACIRRIAARKEVLTITSHNIAPNAKAIHMKTEWLEKILALAQELKLPVLGFDELPPVEK